MKFSVSIVIVLMVGLLALVQPVEAAQARMNGNNWSNIDSIKNQAGNSFILNSTFFCGANTTCIYNANGSVSISSVGGSVTGMSNPATADLNMPGYSVLNATNYTTSQGRHLENGGCDASYCIRYNLTNSSIIEALNGSTGNIDYSGTNAGTVLNSAIGNGNKNIIISSGLFEVGNVIIDLKNNTRINGYGKNLTIFNFTGIESNGYFRSTNYSNIEIGNLKITGTGGIYIAPNRVNISNIYLHDIIGTVEGTHLAFIQAYTTQAIVSDYTIERVDCIDSKTSCFLNRGWNSGGGGESPNIELFDRVHWTDLKAINAGMGTPRFNEWSVGIDLTENVPISNFFVSGCYVNSSWQAGVYAELVANKTNVIISNCISNYNGQNPTEIYGYGFMTSKGMTVSDTIAKGNLRAGYYIDNNADVGDISPDIYISDTQDFGSGRGYSIQGAGIGNVTIDNAITYNAQMSGIKIVNAANIFGNFRIYNPGGEGNLGANLIAADNIIGLSSASNQVYPVTNSRIKVNIKGGSQPNSIYFEGNDNVTLEGSIESTSTNAVIYISGSNNSRINNMHVKSSGDYGVYTRDGSWGSRTILNGVQISNSIFETYTQSLGNIRATGTGNLIVNPNVIAGYYTPNIIVSNSFTSAPSGITGLVIYNSTAKIQQLYNGSAWDWFLMPSKVFGTGVANNNNGSITITDSTYNASYAKGGFGFSIENGTSVIETGYSNNLTTIYAGTLVKLIAHSAETGSLNVSFWNATAGNTYIDSVLITAGTDGNKTLNYAFGDETRIMYNVTSVTDIKKVMITGKIIKS